MIAFPDDSEIYEFHDVTERIRCEAPVVAPPAVGGAPWC